MLKAKNWILQNGGIEGSQAMTKYKLVIFEKMDFLDEEIFKFLLKKLFVEC